MKKTTNNKKVFRRTNLGSICFCIGILFCLISLTGCPECGPEIESISLAPAGAGAGDTATLTWEACWYKDGDSCGVDDHGLTGIRFLPSGTRTTPSINWTITDQDRCDPPHCYRGTAEITLRAGDNRVEVTMSSNGVSTTESVAY